MEEAVIIEEVVVNFKEIGYTDLEGKKVIIKDLDPKFTYKHFAEGIWGKATSLQVDIFARSVYETGEAKVSPDLEEELKGIYPQLWIYPVQRAILETIEKAKENGIKK